MQWQKLAFAERLALTVPFSCRAASSSDFGFSLCLLCRKPNIPDLTKHSCSAVKYLCLVFWGSLLHTAQQSCCFTKSVIPCTAASQTRCTVQLALTRLLCSACQQAALLSSSAGLLLKAKQQHVRICRIPLVAREGATGL